MDILPVESIQERDIDIILLEELNCNNHFAEWFTQQLALPNLSQNLEAWRSISDFGLGETDILCSYRSSEKIIYILIENKLDADFQEAQFERYEKRGNLYKTDKKCDAFYSVLVAPKQFAEGQNDFENYITYEQIKEYLMLGNCDRSRFKAKLLEIAIEKLRRGYQPINSEPVQLFFKSYWELKEKKFPQLKMKKPNIVPLKSDWPEMRDDELDGIIFYHKLSNGFIDMSFCNFSPEVELIIKNQLPVDTIFDKTKKRFSLRKIITRIDRTKSFDSQIKYVEEGLIAIEILRKWALENKNLFIL